MSKFKINLQYFDFFGNYKGSGSYRTDKVWMADIFEEVKEMRATGTLPESYYLSHSSGFIHVDSNSHPNAFPCILPPIASRS